MKRDTDKDDEGRIKTGIKLGTFLVLIFFNPVFILFVRVPLI